MLLSPKIKSYFLTVPNQKIVIIIDDMDRCTKDTVKYAMKLFSEIMLLPKSIIIFVGDYWQLIAEADLKKDFFDKYFTYNYNLCKISFEYLLDYYGEVYSFDKFHLPYFINVSEYIKDMLLRLSEWCSDGLELTFHDEAIAHSHLSSKAMNEAEMLKTNLYGGMKYIKEGLSNPRKIIRIYSEIYDQLNDHRLKPVGYRGLKTAV